MNKDDLLLMYNQDYLNAINSDSYKIGYSYTYIFQQIKRGNFKEALSEIRAKIIALRIRKFSHKRFVKTIKYNAYEDAKVAIYTAIFGKYDELKEPNYVDPKCDYYIITDEVVNDNSLWNPVDISHLGFGGKSDLYKNRYVKMHPFEFFKDYDFVIYVDGNFELCGPVSDLIVYVNPKTNIAVHNMFNRDCIFDEAKACKLLKKGDSKRIGEMITRYKKAGFPSHFGMYECPVIVSRKSNTSLLIFNQWWEQFLKSGGRDQISLPYVIWKNGFEFLDVGIIGNDVRRNCYFRKLKHKKI